MKNQLRVITDYSYCTDSYKGHAVVPFDTYLAFYTSLDKCEVIGIIKHRYGTVTPVTVAKLYHPLIGEFMLKTGLDRRNGVWECTDIKIEQGKMSSLSCHRETLADYILEENNGMYAKIKELYDAKDYLYIEPATK